MSNPHTRRHTWTHGRRETQGERENRESHDTIVVLLLLYMLLPFLRLVKAKVDSYIYHSNGECQKLALLFTTLAMQTDNAHTFADDVSFLCIESRRRIQFSRCSYCTVLMSYPSLFDQCRPVWLVLN